MDWRQHITSDPAVMTGKPVFRGTRMTVEFILERLGEGATEVDLLANYIGLTQEHLQAAHAFAADVLKGEELLFTR